MKVKGYMYPQMKKPVGMLMCYWNLQFRNNESIIKTKVLLPQA
jgi:hypothetical protein